MNLSFAFENLINKYIGYVTGLFLKDVCSFSTPERSRRISFSQSSSLEIESFNVVTRPKNSCSQHWDYAMTIAMRTWSQNVNSRHYNHLATIQGLLIWHKCAIHLSAKVLLVGTALKVGEKSEFILALLRSQHKFPFCYFTLLLCAELQRYVLKCKAPVQSCCFCS